MADEGRRTGPADPAGADPHAAPFLDHRRDLLGAAYRVLGTAQDAEDAVQETWLRWRAVDVATVRDARAYLLGAVTHQALNQIRSRSRRREEYPGPWLPEPVLTGADRTDQDPAHVAEVAAEVSLALLVVLQTLSPLERAAFVLREVFAVPYAEIAQALGRREPAVRQLVRRARVHVAAGEDRHEVDADLSRELTGAFLAAARGEVPLADLVGVLAPDVVLTSDGGGMAKAARRPILGADRTMRFVLGLFEKADVRALTWAVREVNGHPALVATGPRGVDSVTWIESDGRRITGIALQRNPEKLARLER